MRFFSHMKVNIALSLVVVLTIGIALLASVKSTAFAANPIITLTPKSGPPTTVVKVIGRNFGATESVNIDFDTTLVGTATTNSLGSFKAQITVPSSALPGSHTVEAIGQTSNITAQAPFLVQTNWSMFGFDPLHNHFNPYENVLTSANVSGLTVDWTAPTGGAISSSPAVVNGVAYVGSSDGHLYAFNANTGAKLWSAPTAGPITSSPTVDSGLVYVGSSDDKLYVFDAATGALSWSVATGGPITSSPAVSNKTVYIGSTDGKVYAFNTTTHAKLWAAVTGGPINSSPTVANGLVYIGSNDHKLYALNAQTGASAWTAATITGPVLSTPTLANGTVYVTGQNHRVYAFDAFSGAARWSVQGNFNTASVAAANGVVYVGSLDTLYALNASNGSILWTAAARINSSAAVANGVVYVGSTGSKMLAYDATTGAPLRNVTIGGAIRSSSAVANGIVYVGSDDFKLYAFHLPGTAS